MKDYQKQTIDAYDKIVDKFIEQNDQNYDKDSMEKFASLLSPGSLILDLGCGPGRDVKLFLDMNFEVFGIDLSENMVKAARNRVRDGKFFVMDMLDLTFKENTFDGVWACASLLCLEKADTVKAIKEISRVLSPGGYLYLAVRQGTGEGMENTRYGTTKYESYYQKEELKRMLKDYNIIHETTTESESEPDHPWINIIAGLR